MAKEIKKKQSKSTNKDINKVEVVSEVVKPKLPKKSYVIKNRVNVGGQWYEKGSKINLTEQGRIYFVSQKYI
jgi:hypothetical protein